MDTSVEPIQGTEVKTTLKSLFITLRHYLTKSV